MDKYEYTLKLDQMKSLYADENYEAAAEIADTINWNKIKNANALVKAGEIYEKMERYEESRDILLMAYDRSPIGRNIIFRLAEIAVKMKDFEGATEYYNEFVEIAPHDNLRYVLRYDMKKAQGAEYTELIPILEELKDLEYTEEWAYELAYLYHKAGMSDKCVDACDELILWFGDGPFVERALELKMLYQPLSRTQEEKYRKFRLEKQGVTSISGEEMERAGEYVHDPVEIPPIAVNESKFNTVNLQEEIAKGMKQIMEATEKETVSDTMDNIKKIVEEIPYLQLQMGDTQEFAIQQRIEADAEIDGTLKNDFQEMLGEDSDGQISMLTDEKAALEKQITGQMSISEVLGDWERTKRAAEAALQAAEQRKLETAKAMALQEAEDIMDRLNDVIPRLDAGMSPKELLEEEYLQNSEPEENHPEDVESVFEPILLENEAAPEITPVLVGELSQQQDMDAGELFDNVNMLLSQEIERVSNETAMLDEQLEMAAAEPREEADEPLEEAVLETVSAEISDEENVPDNQETGEAELPEEAAPIEAFEVEDLGMETFEEEFAKEGAAVKETVTETPETENFTEEQPEADKEQPDFAMEDLTAGIISELEEEMPEEENAEEAAQEETLEKKEETEQPETAVTAHSLEGLQQALNALDSGSSQKTRPMPTLEDLMRAASAMGLDVTRPLPKVDMPATVEETFIPEEPEEEAEHLSDSQKAVFSYFVPVKGMENQLSHALNNISEHLLREENAFTGNLIIQGGQGCGKTVLATSMIRALQKETGKPNNKVGKINAEALNKKDIQLLLKKVQGGCLIIEHAGELSKQSAVTLSLLLEQDSSGILIILEDTSKGIKRALAQDEGFAKKFTEKITVPIFSNDELVSFANSYSEELGYKIDEMAILALYNRISNIQRLDQETTLTEVKEIVDEAIEREAHSGLKKFFGNLTAKRYSSDDRIILQEKDFE